jgi:hypothetical protein
MAITTTSIIADTIPTVIEEARFTSQFRAIMASLCWNIRKKLHEGSTVNVPYWGTVTANTLTDSIDMTNPQSMEDTNVQITPAEVGVQIVVTHKVARDNQEDVIRAAGRILGNAMEVKREKDLLGQLDDATTSLGAAGTTMTLGHIAAAHALLEGNAVSSGGPAPKPYVVVHHPFTLLDIVDVLTPLLATTTATYQGITAGGGIVDDMLRNYLRGSLFDMPIYSDGNLSIDSSDDAKGGVFAKGKGGSIILATADEWDVKPQDDFSLRATELNVVGEYGVGEYLAGWIVELYMDAGTPA